MRYTGLTVLVLPCLLVAMDAHVLNLAVPRIVDDLHPSGTQLLWIVDGYVFLVAGALLAMGALGDRIGRRRLLLIGVTVFAAASVFAAFAWSAEALIAARMLMGLAGASLMPSTLALIRGMFTDPRRRTVALGVWAASFSLGGLAGPLAGGALLEHLWWGAIFLLAVPVAALVLILGPRLLPEFRDPRAARFDVLGAAQSLLALLAIVYGIKRAAVADVVEAVVALAAGATIAAVFVRRQRRRARPLIDPAPFRDRTVRVALLSTALTFFALYGTEVAIAQYLQWGVGLSPLEAGLWTLPSVLAYLAAAAIGPAAVRRLPVLRVITLALVVVAAGYTLIAVAPDLPGIVAGGVIVSLGLAPAYALGTDVVVSRVDADRAGVAGAVTETGAELGGALGMALLGSFGLFVSRLSSYGDSFAAILTAAALTMLLAAAAVLLTRRRAVAAG
jgi:MFS transporter, DHA2 family, multidrug resistance protein